MNWSSEPRSMEQGGEGPGELLQWEEVVGLLPSTLTGRAQAGLWACTYHWQIPALTFPLSPTESSQPLGTATWASCPISGVAGTGAR